MDCDTGGDWGFGFGWIFPAFLIGKLISDAFDRRAPAPPPSPPWPQPSAPAAARPAAPPPAALHAQPAPTLAACQHCGQTSDARFAFCPQCGHKLSPAACRYCGQQLNPEMRQCAHCGAPRR